MALRFKARITHANRFYMRPNSESWSVFDSARKNDFGEPYVIVPMICQSCAVKVLDRLNLLSGDALEREVENISIRLC